MPKVIEVIYEDGVFKPLEKVELKEKSNYKIVIKEDVQELRGKYGKYKEIDLIEIKDEIYDRRTHIRR